MPHPLLDAPILPTLVRLALPNMLAMVAAAAIGIAETGYVGLLGTDALAALAIVFPFAMLMNMFSVGAMGGGISSAVARAIGAGNPARAASIATTAVAIGLGLGLVFSLLFLAGGRALYSALGARGAVLEHALAYSNVLFAGMTIVWLANSLQSVVRGTGDMRRPSATLLGVAVGQIVLGAALGLGLGPLPKLGMAGIALGQVISFAAAAAFVAWWLASGRAGVRPSWKQAPPTRAAARDILRVGALASLSPLQTVATVLICTAAIARAGTDALAGYGIGSRLEFMLVPIAFAVGVAAVPMVGTAIGAGQIERARKVAWTAATLSAGILGLIGLVVTIAPRAWAGMFASSPGVLDAASSYLRIAGPAFAAYGFGLTLYFAAQGSGRVLGPVLAGTLRLVIVALGAWWFTATPAAPDWAIYAIIAGGMLAYGLATAYAIRVTPWGPR